MMESSKLFLNVLQKTSLTTAIQHHCSLRQEKPFYVPLVHTLFWMGARPSELLGLKWGDVEIRIPHNQ
jgi:integrase